jgi:hypothetical protein
MAKQLYMEITEELVHAVATLTACGLRLNAIMLKTGASAAAIKKVRERPEWATVLAGKEQAVARLMAGGA